MKLKRIKKKFKKMSRNKDIKKLTKEEMKGVKVGDG